MTKEEMETVTARLPRRTAACLKAIAKNTGQTLDDMLGEALRLYARRQEWHIEEVRKAIEEVEQGKFLSEEEVVAEFRDIMGEPTPEHRRLLKAELGRQISVISEEASFSRWAWQIEDELPPLLEEAAAYKRSVVYQGVEISALYAD